MTRLSLSGAWDGAPLPPGVGGHATVQAREGILAWSWEVSLPGSPRVPLSPPGFSDGLWEHDVVELFLTASRPDDPSPEYVELEAGPAGHWLALSFRGVRRRDRELRELTVVPETTVAGLRWSGRVELDPTGLGLDLDAPLRGMAAFCTTLSDGTRVLASSQPLPGARADFHRPAAWTRITAGRTPPRAHRGG